MPYIPIKDIAGANSAIADLYGRADAALKATATLGTATWDGLAGKPATFPPSAHTHDWAVITGKPTTFTPSTHNQDWTTITGKPTTFTPATHTHSYLPLSGGTLTSGLFVNGGINVGGALSLDNDNTNYKSIYWRVGGLNRWQLFATSDPENPSDNAGTNLVLRRWNNAGGYLSDVFQINRIDGRVRFAYTPLVSGADVLHKGDLGAAFNPVLYESPLDANTVVAPFSLCSVNTPMFSGSAFAWVLTMCYPNTTAPTAKVQLAFSYSVPTGSVQMAVRRYYYSAWTNWGTISTVWG